MSYKINIDDFEGPLDLLLFFIQRDKLNIYDIPISKISHDFLSYISELNNMDIEIGADFIYMASVLIKIKSKMLLPKDISESEELIDPRYDLTLQLIEYKKFKKISNHLLNASNDYSNRHKINAITEHEVIDSKSNDVYIGKFNLYDIIKMYSHLIEKLPDEGSYKLNKEEFSTVNQIKLIKNKISNKKRILFSSIIKTIKSKAYIVCTFVAILEMIKNKEIKIEQRNSFSEIYIINNKF
tara:strand:+ start:2519 stop:3238 length:720 start_codon:yes stop_codon:yes gene_type:complete